jgi:protein TonB
VAADGRVAEVLIQESAGHPDLDNAAAEAVKRWRFEPAKRGAEAVGVWVLLPVEFRLR